MYSSNVIAKRKIQPERIFFLTTSNKKGPSNVDSPLIMAVQLYCLGG
jgi:hypothetical protein